MPFTPGRPVAEAKAELFKALAHPARVRVLELLAEREHTVGELAEATGLELSHLSQQVTVLRRAGVVDSRRVRSSVICSLRDPQTAELLAVARRLLTAALREDQALLAALDRADDAVTLADAARIPGVSAPPASTWLRDAGSLLPRRSDYTGLRRSWAADLAAGVTVAVVALPLALAFAVATGVGAQVGLVTAVAAGAVAAVFGGSRVQVSGPTGAMTVVLVPLVAQHGPSVVYPVAVLAGLLVLVAGVLRLGRLLAYVPWPLVEGFTVGIAVIIAAQQVPAALGVERPDDENAVAAAATAVARFATDPGWAVLGLFALAIVLVAALPRLHRALPAGLVAIVAVTALAEVAGMEVAVIGALPSSLPVPALPDLGGAGDLLGAAAVVAFLAALESLLSARVADGMTTAPRHDPDRELVGQGLANVASGVCGGMPATGAIARTAVNARAGARTRLAALTHAGVLAAIVLTASELVSRIPVVVLAGVLVVTAARMVERSAVRAVLRSTRGDAAVFLLTAACTVAFDLVVAVEAGLVLAVLLALVHLSRTARAVPEAFPADPGVSATALLGGDVLAYRFDGPLFFGAADRLLREVTSTTGVRVVILRLGAMAMLDATGARVLGEVVDHLEERGVTVLVKGASDEHLRLLEAVGALAGLRARRHVFTDAAEALAHAVRHVERAASRAGPCEAQAPLS